MQPEPLWKALEQDLTPGEGWLLRRLDSSRPADLFCGLKRPEQRPALILEVPTRVLPPQEAFPSTRGFVLEFAQKHPGPAGAVRIAVVLLEPRWREVFGALVADVAEAVLAQQAPQQQVRVLLARLQVWKHFMETRIPEGLSESAQLGLFAELVVLEQLCLPCLEMVQAVKAWQGPTGALHDFQLPGGVLEVKGSAHQPVVEFRVHHLKQLDETGLTRLALAMVSLEAGPSVVGHSLPEKVAVIEKCLAGANEAARLLFMERLLDAGFVQEQAHRYEGRRYRVAALDLFEVRDGFPRLRVTDVSVGIIDCEYRVSLAACLPFGMTVESLRTAWMEKSHE